MKNLTVILLIMLYNNVFGSIDTLEVKSKITDVTVFTDGAQVTRKIELKAPKGKHLLLVKKLSQEMNAQSIQVTGLKGCKILSVKHLADHNDDRIKSIEELALKNKIDKQEFVIKEISNKMSVFEIEENLILENRQLSGKSTGITVSQIKEAADFFRSRINEIRQFKLALNTELDEANQRHQDLYNTLNALSSEKRKSFSQVLITLECDRDINDDLTISYFIASAGWEPLYDFRVDDISKPFVIVYNANVFQTSGEDWNNVSLKLSNNNPKLSGEKPVLNTWFLGRRTAGSFVQSTPGICALKGRVIDNITGMPIAFASVAVLNGTNQVANVQTDFDGQYSIKPLPQGNFTIRTDYVGYNSLVITNVHLEHGKTVFQDLTLGKKTVELSEVEIVAYKVPLIDKGNPSVMANVTRDDINFAPSRDSRAIASTASGVFQRNDGYDLNDKGGRTDATGYYLDGVKVRGGIEITNNISNSLKSNITTLEYVIEIPYSIPSDGEDYSIKIKEVSVPVDYVYHAVPKIDNGIFLSAEIPEWNKLNLLSGKSSIYFQGTYTGQSFIDAEQTMDTLTVSLGRDKDILIKREANKEVSDKKINGNTIKETIGLDITIRNNKNQKIKIVIEDQYPVSERKSIEINTPEAAGAMNEEKTGRLTWELNLDANQKKMLSYKYSVKYPKAMDLALE